MKQKINNLTLNVKFSCPKYRIQIRCFCVGWGEKSGSREKNKPPYSLLP
jgi:hypothetical protein